MGAIALLWLAGSAITLQPAVIGGIALIFAAYVGTLVPLSETGVRVVAAAAIVGLSLAIFLFGDGGAGALAAPSQFAPASWTGAGIALIAVLWAYDGWGELLYAAGEVKDPERNLPRALIGGSLVVAAVYLLANRACSCSRPSRCWRTPWWGAGVDAVQLRRDRGGGGGVSGLAGTGTQKVKLI